MKYLITAYPYATMYGRIEVPDEVVENGTTKEWLSNHFNEINFDEPELDFCGTDFDYEEEIE